jgi:hypothetical protein
VERWFDNFADRHGVAGSLDCRVESGALVASAPDGTWCLARLPFGQSYDGPGAPAAFAKAVAVPHDWGLLLVRKGGFAVARLAGGSIVASKVGRRHVQGRTKAGGQSQQRFARRRANQAREAYEAAAEHSWAVLGPHLRSMSALVCGGDRDAVRHVLADRRLVPFADLRTDPWLDVPDPRRAVLERAAVDGSSATIEIHEPASAS